MQGFVALQKPGEGKMSSRVALALRVPHHLLTVELPHHPSTGYFF